MRRADVAVLLFDVTEKLGSIEKRLARYVIDHHKPVILAANKWDLAAGYTPEDFVSYIRSELTGLTFAPIAFISSKSGQGVEELFERAGRRVGTGELNRVLERALDARAPGAAAQRGRVKYATQAEVHPPTFVLFVNDKKSFGKDTLRYIQNRLREELGFDEIPVRVVLKAADAASSEARTT